MYLNCISFINQVKKGSFAEHSPMLNDISGAASWTKVTQGMVKMYQAKVL
jgi:serine/threonine-protein phosphatase 2A activator